MKSLTFLSISRCDRSHRNTRTEEWAGVCSADTQPFPRPALRAAQPLFPIRVKRRFAAARAFPSSVLGPVDVPPWNLHRHGAFAGGVHHRRAAWCAAVIEALTTTDGNLPSGLPAILVPNPFEVRASAADATVHYLPLLKKAFEARLRPGDAAPFAARGTYSAARESTRGLRSSTACPLVPLT